MEIMTADDLLSKMHAIIDTRFKRENRDKYINPYLLKAKMTMFCISVELSMYEPDLIATLMNELIKRGSVVTNLNERGVFVFDAYFIPKSELMSEADYDVYARVKSKLHQVAA